MSLTALKQSSSIDIQPKLPPMHISKLLSSIFEENGQSIDGCFRKIEEIVGKISLISQDNYQQFKKRSNHQIGGYEIVSYSAIIRNRDPIFIALGEEKEEVESDENRGQHEFLIFLFQSLIGAPKSSQHNQEVYVLSTGKAYKFISGYCSQEFSKNLSAYFSSFLPKIEQVVTSQLFGPIAQSNLQVRRTLPPQVEQSGLVCSGFTAVVQPFTPCIGGSEVKVKFKENGIVIYRDLSLENYTEIANTFSKNTSHNTSKEWGIASLPKEFSKIDNTLVKAYGYEKHLFSYMTQADNIPSTWQFSLSIADRFFSNADEYRLYYVEYVGPHRGTTHSFPKTFTQPHRCPTIEDLREQLVPYRKDINSFEYVLQHREVKVQYKVGGIWLEKYVLECVEGYITDINNNGVVYTMDGNWYTVPENYLKKVNDACQKIVTECLISPGSTEALLDWQKALKEPAYNALCGTRVDNISGALWFSANSILSLSCELFDILSTVGNTTYIYHVKAKFDHDIRVGVTQLLMSAQIIRDSLSRGDHTALIDYCQRVSTTRWQDLYGALKKNRLVFVLAFSLDANNPVSAIVNSGSLTAKREVIRLKEGIEALNEGGQSRSFEMKIYPIKRVK